jgi:predicted nucleic acid-binding protein
VDRIAESDHGYGIHNAVREVSLVLINLLRDADAGMLAAVADQARAEAFDDFLDHAAQYLKSARKQEAGVIAGVVFEDAVRRISRKLLIPEKGEKLDALISALASRGEITAVKAKRARVAADVRTKATHAQWDEYEVEDVRATIEFTRELIEAKLA